MGVDEALQMAVAQQAFLLLYLFHLRCSGSLTTVSTTNCVLASKCKANRRQLTPLPSPLHLKGMLNQTLALWITNWLDVGNSGLDLISLRIFGVKMISMKEWQLRSAVMGKYNKGTGSLGNGVRNLGR